MSASPAASDTLIHVAWITAQASLAGTALLLLCVFWMHWRRNANEARRRAFVARWRPALAAVALDGSGAHFDALPRLDRRDFELFLHEWIAIHEALDRESCQGLEALSQRLRVGDLAGRMLGHTRLESRLLGTIALGHVGDSRQWDALLAETDSHNLTLSLAAARALVRLDPERAIVALVPVIERRADWPHTRIWPLLEEAGPAALTGPLVAAIRGAAPEQQARLARFLPLADETAAGELVADLLGTTTSDQVVASCLGVVDSPAELATVRGLAAHPRWHIRMLAAKALGRLGERQDEALLTSMLGDAEWWVRYRAAQALVALPWMRKDRAGALRDTLTDRFAKDAMEQALAERGYR
ncbi:MAG: HEAT repeat domain-containing protein [Steroidobacteraceae bacterium]|jgi:HEAT repeat protein|nr:HEAT repeat domain-containing protein [Steroidobacteraceae bacterium]